MSHREQFHTLANEQCRGREQRLRKKGTQKLQKLQNTNKTLPNKNSQHKYPQMPFMTVYFPELMVHLIKIEILKYNLII